MAVGVCVCVHVEIKIIIQGNCGYHTSPVVSRFHQNFPPPRNTLFLRPSQLIVRSSILIGSAVFVRVPNVMPYNVLSVGKRTFKTARSPWDFVKLPEEDWAMARGSMHKKFKDHTCGSKDILMNRWTDRHTHTDVLTTILHNRSRGWSNNIKPL